MTKSRSCSKSKHFVKRFRRYALAAGGAVSMCGLAETADAAIVHFDPADITADGDDSERIRFNLISGYTELLTGKIAISKETTPQFLLTSSSRATDVSMSTSIDDRDKNIGVAGDRHHGLFFCRSILQR